MSVLAWLFGLGALSIAFPFVFHLIRRRPQGQMVFSSLMFLRSTPPRITRRSRLENWWLLLLRCLIIALIAAAFMRPFFRDGAILGQQNVSARRIAVLLDRSASMRRGDHWQQAKGRILTLAESLEPQDEMAVFAFDTELEPIVDFSSSASQANVQSPGSRLALLNEKLQALEPSWQVSDVGLALVNSAESLIYWRDAQDLAEDAVATKLQIVLISDLQKSSELQALQSYQWPPEVLVDLQQVGDELSSNATLQILQSLGETEPTTLDGSQNLSSNQQDSVIRKRLRLINEGQGQATQFVVRWFAETDPVHSQERAENGAAPAAIVEQKIGGEIPLVVPPGESRIVNLADAAAGTGERFELQADDPDFDNQYFIIPPQRQTFEILYIGEDAAQADDANSLLFYLQRALPENEFVQYSIRSISPQQPLRIGSSNTASGDATGGDTPGADDNQSMNRISPPLLVVVSCQLEPAKQREIRAFVEQGGTALLVLTDSTVAAAWRELAGIDSLETSNLESAETVRLAVEGQSDQTLEDSKQDLRSDLRADLRTGYSMWVEIDFGHWLLAPFANPKFNDFTKIRYWQFPRVKLREETNLQVVARYDQQWPALWERRLIDASGTGSIVCLAASWQPAASQLALSSKFVPLWGNLLQHADQRPRGKAAYLVGEVLPWPLAASATPTSQDRRGDRLSDAKAWQNAKLTWHDSQSTRWPLAVQALGEGGFFRPQSPGIYELEVERQRFRFAVNVDRRESVVQTLTRDPFLALDVPLDFHSSGQEDLGRLTQLQDIELEDKQKFWKWLIVAAIAGLALESIVAAVTAGTVNQGGTSIAGGKVEGGTPG